MLFLIRCQRGTSGRLNSQARGGRGGGEGGGGRVGGGAGVIRCGVEVATVVQYKDEGSKSN